MAPAGTGTGVVGYNLQAVVKDWMGRNHFKTRKLKNVATEASLHILAYNIKRAIALLGTTRLIAAMQA